MAENQKLFNYFNHFSTQMFVFRHQLHLIMSKRPLGNHSHLRFFQKTLLTLQNYRRIGIGTDKNVRIVLMNE